MYLSLYDFIQAIKLAKLDASYPKIDKHIEKISTYLFFQSGRLSRYQRYGKKLINILKNYIRIPGTDFTNLNLFKTHLETHLVGESKTFIVYSEHNIRDFNAVKYLEKFCKIPIDKIIEAFGTLNMKRDCWGAIELQQYSVLFEFVKKLLTTHMVLHLAKHFYIIEIALHTKSLTIIDTAFLFRPGSNKLYKNYLKEFIINDSDVGKIIDDTNSDFTKFINTCIPAVLFSKKFTKFKNLITKLYEEYKMQHFFLTNLDSDELDDYFSKNNDFRAMFPVIYFLRKIGKKTFKSFIIKSVIDSNNLVLNLFFKKEGLGSSSRPMHKLIMPKIMSMDKIYMIEV